MLPQSYRHYPIHPIRAVVTSIIFREVLLYLIIYHSFYSVNNETNVILWRKKERDYYPSHTSILYLLTFTLIYSYQLISQLYSIIYHIAQYHYIIISLTLSYLLLIFYYISIYHITVVLYQHICMNQTLS